MIGVWPPSGFFAAVLPPLFVTTPPPARFASSTVTVVSELTSTFMTDERRYTLPVLIQSSVGEFSQDYGFFAAGAVLTSIPVMVAFYVLQKYLVGGLTAGAVKG